MDCRQENAVLFLSELVGAEQTAVSSFCRDVFVLSLFVFVGARRWGVMSKPVHMRFMERDVQMRGYFIAHAKA